MSCIVGCPPAGILLDSHWILMENYCVISRQYVVELLQTQYIEEYQNEKSKSVTAIAIFPIIVYKVMSVGNAA